MGAFWLRELIWIKFLVRGTLAVDVQYFARVACAGVAVRHHVSQPRWSPGRSGTLCARRLSRSAEARGNAAMEDADAGLGPTAATPQSYAAWRHRAVGSYERPGTVLAVLRACGGGWPTEGRSLMLFVESCPWCSGVRLRVVCLQAVLQRRKAGRRPHGVGPPGVRVGQPGRVHRVVPHADVEGDEPGAVVPLVTSARTRIVALALRRVSERLGEGAGRGRGRPDVSPVPPRAPHRSRRAPAGAARAEGVPCARRATRGRRA